MTDKNCDHFSTNSTFCKFCGYLQCEYCWSAHKEQHIANGDKELDLDIWIFIYIKLISRGYNNDNIYDGLGTFLKWFFHYMLQV